MVVVSKKNLDRLEGYGFGGILIDVSQDKDFYKVKIFLDRVIKLPSVIYYLIKDGVIECI